MNPREALTARLGRLGIDEGTVVDYGATLRPTPIVDAYQATLPSVPPEQADDRLPVISVDLRGTLSGPDVPAQAVSGVNRDLEVRSTLGEGGMGRVFLARQHSLDRDVAIKTTKDSANAGARRALIEEGVVTGHLEHPSIVPVHALGTDASGRPVLVMKRIEGVEWSQLLADPAHPFWEDRGGDASDRLPGHLEILVQVCNAVHFANSRGVVHRDIKPQNVMIGRFGDVYLADWGVALRLDVGAPLDDALRGTPAYMAPEMVLGGPIDARADVYLLAATLHEILTGAPPHEGKTLADVLAAAALGHDFSYPDSAPHELAGLAMRAMALDPDARPRSAAAFRRGVQAFLEHRSSLALASSAIERLDALKSVIEREPDESVAEVHAEIDRLVAETRFGLQQALAQWAGNTAAQRAAADLDGIEAVRRARAAELHKLARELDPAVSWRQRQIVMGIMAAVGVTLSVVGVVQYRLGRVFDVRELFYQSLLPTGAVLFAGFVMRKAATRTLLNRRIFAVALVAVVVIVVSRALALASGESIHHTLMQDCLLVAATMLVGAATVFGWMSQIALLLLAAAFVCALSPSESLLAFSLATGLALVLSAYHSWRIGAGTRA